MKQIARCWTMPKLSCCLGMKDLGGWIEVLESVDGQWERDSTAVRGCSLHAVFFQTHVGRRLPLRGRY